MNLLPSPEQEEIVSAASTFLSGTLPTTRTRALIDEPSNVDADGWAAAAALGWFALGLPERLGGVGCGLADEALLFREIGRALASGPFLATTLGARVAAFGGDEVLAEAIMGGRQVGLAVLGRDTTIDDTGVTGELQLLDAADAELVLAAAGDEACLLALGDLDDVVDIDCIDATTRLARGTAAGVAPVARVSSGVDPVTRRGMICAAAMLSGIAEATCDISAEHAKTRIQFDRPIGVNQAIKHPCADMAVRAQLAWAQTIVAALAVDEGRGDAEFQTLSAKVVAADAAERNAGATIQVLGGMGFSFEHDANLYLKRAHVLSSLFGETSETLSRLITLPAAV
jgi:alkylation response protein AidB-like acyl-CoA dehydrogenase